MHSTHLAALGAALLIAGGGHGSRPSPAATRLAAQVRFANHLNGTHTWTLFSNRVVLFADVAAGTTTRYLATTDSTSALTLHRDGGDSVFASTNYLFVAGSYYTVTATYGDAERPVLAVERDPPPRDTMPVQGSLR